MKVRRKRRGIDRQNMREVHHSQIAIVADGLAPDGMQEIREGIKAGDEVVTNALEFSTEVAEKRAGE